MKTNTPAWVEELEREKRTLVSRLRGLGTQINAYYPRPAGSPVPFGEDILRSQARGIEDRIRGINEKLKGDA